MTAGSGRRGTAKRLAPAPLGPRRLRRPPLPPGGLRNLVLAHLATHPELDFSPAELANVLDRCTSRGAIINACKRLVQLGLATRTQQRPQRYRKAD